MKDMEIDKKNTNTKENEEMAKAFIKAMLAHSIADDFSYKKSPSFAARVIVVIILLLALFGAFCLVALLTS